MRTKGNKFDLLASQILGDDNASSGDPVAEKPSVRPSRVKPALRSSANKRQPVFEARQASVAEASSGKIKTVKILAVDPARIRPWSGHNRDYAELSETRCADLIDGFKRIGQQFPAIVRALPADDDQHDYEFICGARRHWTATHMGRDLQVEVRVMDDKEAFLLQDVENRDREDISDYERACDYVRALPLFFDGNKSRMAESLQIDPGNFSRMLQLADLPTEIVEAYSDRRDLLTHHGQIYTKALTDAAAAKRLIAAAKDLKDRELTGRQVIKLLKGVIAQKGRAAPTPARRKATRMGELEWSPGAKKGQCELNFKVPDASDHAAIERLVGDFTALLKKLAE